MLSVKQEGINYRYFESLVDSTWDWTQVSQINTNPKNQRNPKSTSMQKMYDSLFLPQLIYLALKYLPLSIVIYPTKEAIIFVYKNINSLYLQKS